MDACASVTFLLKDIFLHPHELSWHICFWDELNTHVRAYHFNVQFQLNLD